jgi:hypothetical protein
MRDDERRNPGPWPRIERASPARLSAILAGIVCLILSGLITHGNYAGSGDAVHYMMIARSLVLGGDFDLSDDYGAASNILDTAAGRHALVGRGGALRPVHDVGLPVLAAPYFAVAYYLADLTDRLPESLRRRAKLDRFIALRQLVALLMIAVTALLAVVFFRTCWTATGEKSLSWIWAIVWTLSPPILSHGYVFLTEVPSALLALIVFRHRGDVLASPRRGALLGLLTGLLVLVHVRNVGLAMALVSLSLWQARSEVRRLPPYLAGIAAMSAIRVALNLSFWGTPFTTPHVQVGAWPGIMGVFSEITERGMGLLFDARHGLLVSAPVYLAVPAAWLLLWRRSRGLAIELLGVVLGYLAFVLMPMSNVHGWRGGWNPAARFLVPIVAFAALAVPALMADRRGRWFVVGLLCVQLPLNAFFWRHPMLTWSEGPGPAPFIEGLFGSRVAARLPPVDGLPPTAALVAFGAVALWLLSAWMIVRRPASAPKGAR